MIALTEDGREIFYRVSGIGSPILLVHGAWPEHFSPLVAELGPRYQCIAFDRLGFRQSSQLQRNTTMAEQAMAMATVQRRVTAEPAWVFGHSSGGNFALGYALLRPDRVKGLILVEPALYGIYPSEPPQVPKMRGDAVPLIQQGQLLRGWAAFIAAIFGPQDREWNATEEDLAIIRAFGYDQPIVYDWRPDPAQLEQVSQPVLILEGDQSPKVLRDICPLLGSLLPNSKLLSLKGADHLMPSRAPQKVAAAMTSFIAEF